MIFFITSNDVLGGDKWNSEKKFLFQEFQAPHLLKESNNNHNNKIVVKEYEILHEDKLC